MKLTNYLTKDWKNGNDIGLFLLRVSAGFALLYGHGFQKLSVILTGQEINFMDPIGIGAIPSYYLAGFAEGICAILLIAGLLSRFASSVLSINFIVVIIFHLMSGHGFDVMELPIFYLVSFLTLTLTGPGKLSLDYRWFKKNKLSYQHYNVTQLS
ncbi:MAG: DoxX family protein [Bacteroidetes bacterium]|nr:DoxX family protein [Bacteroidota bacterium]